MSQLKLLQELIFGFTVVRAGVFEAKKGSAYVELCGTKLVCVVDGPVEPDRSGGVDDEEGMVKVEVIGSSNLSQVLESALCSFVRLDRFPKAQINLDVIILEDSATSLAAALMASSVALCNAGIETYDICLASHFWVSAEGELLGSKLAPGDEYSSLTVAVLPSLNQMVCCEHQGIIEPSILMKAVPSAIEKSLSNYSVVRRAIEAFSIPVNEKKS
ncbi:unnamed protein product [Enterobius vermicularis]|uniref:RNase_PH domain-containing protein n=1 Tax=Enterobius vermicularis TaxID=51028 RepID=A0A0N4VFL3_ENTVE|nr:unnamed protein product [Enterobius vermicularis]